VHLLRGRVGHGPLLKITTFSKILAGANLGFSKGRAKLKEKDIHIRLYIY